MILEPLPCPCCAGLGHQTVDGLGTDDPKAATCQGCHGRGLVRIAPVSDDIERTTVRVSIRFRLREVAKGKLEPDAEAEALVTEVGALVDWARRDAIASAADDSPTCAIADVVRYLRARLAHYPEDVFPPPPKGEHGATVDTCSARAMRFVLASCIRELESGAWGRYTPARDQLPNAEPRDREAKACAAADDGREGKGVADRPAGGDPDEGRTRAVDASSASSSNRHADDPLAPGTWVRVRAGAFRGWAAEIVYPDGELVHPEIRKVAIDGGYNYYRATDLEALPIHARPRTLAALAILSREIRAWGRTEAPLRSDRNARMPWWPRFEALILALDRQESSPAGGSS